MVTIRFSDSLLNSMTYKTKTTTLHIVRGCLLLSVVLFTSCDDLFGPKQLPLVPKREQVDSSGTSVQCVVKIGLDGDSFYVMNDTTRMAFSDVSLVDSILPELVSGSADSSVIITWTGKATYGDVIEVIDILKKNGITKYALTGEK